MKFIIIYITHPNMKEAKQVANALDFSRPW